MKSIRYAWDCCTSCIYNSFSRVVLSITKCRRCVRFVSLKMGVRFVGVLACRVKHHEVLVL